MGFYSLQSLFWFSNCLIFGQWEPLQAVFCVLLACSHHSLNTSLHSGTKQQQHNPKRTKKKLYIHLCFSCSSYRTRQFLEHILIPFSGAWYLGTCLPDLAWALTSHARLPLMDWSPFHPTQTVFTALASYTTWTPSWLFLGFDTLARLLSSGWLSYPSHAPQVWQPAVSHPHTVNFLTLFGLRLHLPGRPTTGMCSSHCSGSDAPCQDAFVSKCPLCPTLNYCSSSLPPYLHLS